MPYCCNCWQAVDEDWECCEECGFPRPYGAWLVSSPEGKVLQDGKYRIVAPIGAGGFGCTVKGIQYVRGMTLGPVAIKFPVTSVGDPQDTYKPERFLEEAAALRTITHPNIVALYDAFVEENTPYLVMEFIEEATTLAHEPPEVFRHDLQAYLSVCSQIASAIRGLHAKGTVHCDLKPSNIGLISYMGGYRNFVKVLDFGIAASWKRGHGWLGSSMGTIGFAAPEQLAGRPTPRSDVFSLGVLMYFLLTGELPYPPEVFTDGSDIRRFRTPRPEGVPPELAKLIERCLSLDADRRYPAMPDQPLMDLCSACGASGDVETGASFEDQKSLLRLAKDTFLEAGLSKNEKDRRALYARSADLFEKAKTLGQIPQAMEKFAYRADQYSGRRIASSCAPARNGRGAGPLARIVDRLIRRR